VAKLDLRLVPDMKATEALGALKAHLAKHGFGDIEVNMTGGYDPNSTSADAGLIRAQTAVYKREGIDPIVLPRSAGSWPGYVFTGEPLHLAAGHFGLGHGSGAHAPDEYYVIESKNPKVQGMDGAVRSYVEYLYEVAATKCVQYARLVALKRLSHHFFTFFPERLSSIWIDCVPAYPVAYGDGQIVSNDRANMAVFTILAADLTTWCDHTSPHRSRGALRDRLPLKGPFTLLGSLLIYLVDHVLYATGILITS
jgi:hypothetical protein